MSIQEAREEAEVDWSDDADGKDFISQEALEVALFQLVDVWCKSVKVFLLS